MIPKLCWVILMVWGGNICMAQLTKKDTLHWGYKLTLNGSLLTGNVERMLVISGVEIAHTTDKIGLITTNTYQYGTIRKNKTENDVISKNFFYLLPHKPVYPYLMGWFEKNLRRKIDFRHQLGIGGSWSFLEGEKHQMKVSITVTHETTNFSDNSFIHEPNAADDKISTWRVTTRLIGYHYLLKNKITLNYEAWAQPSIEDKKNYRYHVDASLGMPLYEKLMLRTAVYYTFENIVLEGIDKEDLYWTFGLSFGNY